MLTANARIVRSKLFLTYMSNIGLSWFVSFFLNSIIVWWWVNLPVFWKMKFAHSFFKFFERPISIYFLRCRWCCWWCFIVAIDAPEFLIYTAVFKQIFHQKLKRNFFTFFFVTLFNGGTTIHYYLGFLQSLRDSSLIQ